MSNPELVKTLAERSEAGLVASDTVGASWRGFMTQSVASWVVEALIANGFYITSKPPGTIEWE